MIVWLETNDHFIHHMLVNDFRIHYDSKNNKYPLSLCAVPSVGDSILKKLKVCHVNWGEVNNEIVPIISLNAY